MQVNIASRAAALSPGATDPLATFEGAYTTHYLPNSQGKKVANKGPELVISVSDGEDPFPTMLRGAVLCSYAHWQSGVRLYVGHLGMVHSCKSALPVISYIFKKAKDLPREM